MNKRSMPTEAEIEAIASKLREMKEEDIDTTDPDARVIPRGLGPRTIEVQLDADVLEWLKGQAGPLPARINKILRQAMVKASG